MTDYLEVGEITPDEHIPQDAIPALLDALRGLSDETAQAHYAAFVTNGAGIPAHAMEDDQADWWRSHECEAMQQELIEILADYCPPLCCINIHNGAIFVGPDWCQINETARAGDLLRVSDLSEVPDGYKGDVLHVNDHGNVTVYQTDMDQEHHEIWSVV